MKDAARTAKQHHSGGRPARHESKARASSSRQLAQLRERQAASLRVYRAAVASGSRVERYQSAMRYVQSKGEGGEPAVSFTHGIKATRFRSISRADAAAARDERFLRKRDGRVTDGACFVWRVAVSRGARYVFGPNGLLYPADERSHRIKLHALFAVLEWLGYVERGGTVTLAMVRSYRNAVWRLRTRLIDRRALSRP